MGRALRIRLGFRSPMSVVLAFHVPDLALWTTAV
jgi:hypothetical protein